MTDGLGPDGNRDVTNPQNTKTCDTDENGSLDGNRLFSRPPLVVHLQISGSGYRKTDTGNALYLIVNHWKSKSQDTETTAYTLPRRLLQSQYVADLIQEILSADPEAELIVLGDFNDYRNSEPVQTLVSAGMVDLLDRVGKPARYTFIYQGISQTLDHFFASPALQTNLAVGLFPRPVHINADYPVNYEGDESTAIRSSDHDPVVVDFIALDHFLYLPVVNRNR